jgi:hypothetical protein
MPLQLPKRGSAIEAHYKIGSCVGAIFRRRRKTKRAVKRLQVWRQRENILAGVEATLEIQWRLPEREYYACGLA